MRHDPDTIADWKRKRWAASIVMTVGLLVQTIGFRFAGSSVSFPVRALVVVGTFVAAVVSFYYWYQLKQLPVST